jgi:hypothetical protein
MASERSQPVYESHTCAFPRCCFRYMTTFGGRTAYGHGCVRRACNGAKTNVCVATKVAEEINSRVARDPHAVRIAANSMLVHDASNEPKARCDEHERHVDIEHDSRVFFDASERMQGDDRRICKRYGLSERYACKKQLARRANRRQRKCSDRVDGKNRVVDAMEIRRALRAICWQHTTRDQRPQRRRLYTPTKQPAGLAPFSCCREWAR